MLASFRAAVGERSGEWKLYISDKLNVDHRAYKADGHSRRAVSTQMVALDDYFKSGERVDFIKMDIQGYELHALRGARRVLQENPEINLLLEFWPAGLEQAGVGWGELVELLQGLNMNLALVNPDGLVPFDGHDVRRISPGMLTSSSIATAARIPRQILLTIIVE